MFLATPPCFNTLSFLTMVTTFAPERVIVCLTLRLASVFIFIFFVYVMAQRQQYCDRGGWDGQREDHAAHAVPTRGRLHQLRDGGMHAATQSCSHERGQASERGDEQQPGRGGELRFLLNALKARKRSVSCFVYFYRVVRLYCKTTYRKSASIFRNRILLSCFTWKREKKLFFQIMRKCHKHHRDYFTDQHWHLVDEVRITCLLRKKIQIRLFVYFPL